MIHWSDWAQQPEIRIACTQRGHHPWILSRKDLPSSVHEVPARGDQPEWLYTFNTGPVTCGECRKLESFQQKRKQDLDYEQQGHCWSSGGPRLHCVNCGVLEPVTACVREHEQPCNKCRDVGPCDNKEVIRPSGTVELGCNGCGRPFWVDALYPMLFDDSICQACEMKLAPMRVPLPPSGSSGRLLT